MTTENIRTASPEEIQENKRKQCIMLKHNINVKVDGSWGPWQQGQWEKLLRDTEEERTHIKGKKIEAIIGLFLLLPAVLGILAFVLQLFGADTKFSGLRHLGWRWTAGDNGMSAAPIFLGLMALAACYLLKDSIKYLFRKPIII